MGNLPQTKPDNRFGVEHARQENGKLRDEFLNGEIFYSMKEAQILTERWRVEYNTERPHFGAGLQATGTASYLAETKMAWRYGKRSAFPTSPHPRRRLRTNV
jgi:putative transposase